ncbi:hypothetical protein HanIR_Chr01g0028811 [Helianthus annuus]|nr:hypothetical protein HanIR_Chr01g0028811 [Helianthus annuus]
MQRYHATNCTSAVNNSAVGGSLGRDTSRAESSALPANFSKFLSETMYHY